MCGTLYTGSSGFSYPSWRPGFYPAGTKPGDFLLEYARRLPAVELNATGRRLPAPEQLARWASVTPTHFRFAVKLTTWIPSRPQAAAPFCEAVRVLGDRLGPVLVQLPPLGRHDQDILERLAGALAPGIAYALEPKDDAWLPAAALDAFAGHDATLVGTLGSSGSTDYLRLRSPPHDEAALRELAAQIAPSLVAGRDVYAFFRHEDEPTAPAYAARLHQLVTQANQHIPQVQCGERSGCGKLPAVGGQTGSPSA